MESRKETDALKAARGLSFESIVVAVESGACDIVEHPK